MKLNPLAFAAVALVSSVTASVALADPGAPLAIGAKMPTIADPLPSVTSADKINLNKIAGPKGSVVIFTCNGCPYARAWEDRIVELANTYAKKGLGVVLVNSNNPTISKGDTEEATRQRAKEKGIQVPYAVDAQSNVAKAFGASKTPEAFVFDKGGSLVYHGTIDDNHEEPAKVSKRYLKDALDAVVAGKKPDMAETKSLGCSIKFAKVS